jgi:anti-anti-sigma factor
VRARVQVDCEPPRARLRIDGELDLAANVQLRHALARVAFFGCHQVDVDLDAVTFVEASSLRLLDQERARLARIGGRLEVVAASADFLLACDVVGYPDLKPAVNGSPRPVPALDEAYEVVDSKAEG